MLSFRDRLRENDPEIIARIAASTGFFDDRDIQLNTEIARHLLHHKDCEHRFLFAEDNGKTVAYACFEELPDAKAGTYELFWLSTLNEYRGLGIGRRLVAYLIEHLKSLGAERLYVKTDSTAQYEPTRRFYEKCGFRLRAVLPEYYGTGDDCCIYCLDIAEDGFGFSEQKYAAAE
ncbi:MAG: GNAT family N-acetyltransferase [Pseudomonadota bacterium]|nr:GNAT family N-acetyltransferase [Pseudomonadota bacterium]